MPRTIRNEFDKKLSYESLMKAHKLSRKGKGYRKEIILFNLKQEEYIMWLYEKLKSGTYKHSGYTVFYALNCINMIYVLVNNWKHILN